jgi:hypothetical protein
VAVEAALRAAAAPGRHAGLAATHAAAIVAVGEREPGKSCVCGHADGREEGKLIRHLLKRMAGAGRNRSDGVHRQLGTTLVGELERRLEPTALHEPA